MRTTSPPEIELDDLVDPACYARGGPQETWARLRAESPVHWCEIEGVRPFWAITRHADVRHVSVHPESFSSAGRLLLTTEKLEDKGSPLLTKKPKTLLSTDPPEHREYRNLSAAFFRPSVLRRLEERIREITVTLLDTLAAHDEPFDLVTDFAAWHPLRMICEILGIPEADEDLVLHLANAAFGATDPEYARDTNDLLAELFGFLSRLIAEKRSNPAEDLASVVANAELHGEPLGDFDLMVYFMILVTAGHETTRSAISGGLLALIEHPAQLDLLGARQDLIPTAVDEMVRWTSPVQSFMRTATEDTAIGGQPIAEGDALALFYMSANRDESVFDDPFTFRVDRDPNPHLGFGIGEHYCLGASLARLEMRILFEELLPRLDRIELAGDPEFVNSTFAPGPKHVPVRWRLSS